MRADPDPTNVRLQFGRAYAGFVQQVSQEVSLARTETDGLETAVVAKLKM